MRTLTFLLLFSCSLHASAGCWFNGQMYPTGTRVGGYICQPDGSWR